jgi:hypothetical protein
MKSYLIYGNSYLIYKGLNTNGSLLDLNIYLK